MIVYKTYLRIIKAYFLNIMMVVLISIGLSFAISQSEPTNIEESFKELKVSIINKDNSNINDLEAYLKKEVTLVEETFTNDKAMYKEIGLGEKVNYVLLVNKNKLESIYAPDNTEALILDQKIKVFENLNYTYQLNDTSTESLSDDLNKKVEVSYVVEDNALEKAVATTFNVFIYGLVGAIISAICIISITFKRDSISQRTLVSSTNRLSYNLQLMLGHLSIALGVWLFMIIFTVIKFGPDIWDTHIWYYILNSFMFLFPITALAFLVSSLTNSLQVASGFTNVLSLGFSFLSGAFIPLALLEGFTIKIAQFTPSYWYGLNNDIISNTTKIHLNMFSNTLLIQILFTLAFLSSAVIINRGKIKK